MAEYYSMKIAQLMKLKQQEIVYIYYDCFLQFIIFIKTLSKRSLRVSFFLFLEIKIYFFFRIQIIKKYKYENYKIIYIKNKKSINLNNRTFKYYIPILPYSSIVH